MAGIPDGNRELLPTLPPPASTAGIPINFGIISHKTTTKKGKKKTKPQPQPTLPKGKQKNSQNFHFGVSGDVGKAQNPRDEKEPRWFFFLSISNCKVWELPTVPESIPTRIQGKKKKVGSSRSNSHFPAKFWVAANPKRPKKKNKNPNHTQPELGISLLSLSLSAESSEFREYRDVLLSRLEKEQGKGAAMKSAH